ncbi:DNA-binding LacI/PurR family transcriptional regulator [Microbacterium trichothecenolyticum]|uniref:LacI family DNA-binding transcriptional regulator n=1 Tax=Microbacterium trichothecenolyticum TaxID=69370 RepID=UPI00286572D7|nr:LacI family DNA-binding transcriptional regulator [Microbacterium trichothecenolyticum]MDR7187138.1 DNA-binding LacI/PurR family transcriptional regulator [Microbacterium trichothecenolyticum]
MSAKMQDVARLAGVSTKTVSNVINGRPYVAAETRRKVEAAIDALDYKLNLAARNLRSGRSGVIGLAVPSLSVAYFAELAEATVAAAEEQGLVVQIERTGSVARERALLNSPRLQHIDGLILNPMDHGAEELESVQLSVPTVVLGDHAVGGAVVHVSTDQRAAAALATEHLLLTGRRRIAVIGARSSDSRGSAALRFDGYRSVLERAGIPIERDLIAEADPWIQINGATAMRELLRGGAKFDAVFAFNDSLALGAMRALDDAGLHVPGDVAVIGIDNTAEASYSIPSLSTVDLGRQRIAETAVAALTEQMISNERPVPRRVLVDFTLLARESTRR